MSNWFASQSEQRVNFLHPCISLSLSPHTSLAFLLLICLSLLSAPIKCVEDHTWSSSSSSYPINSHLSLDSLITPNASASSDKHFSAFLENEHIWFVGEELGQVLCWRSSQLWCAHAFLLWKVEALGETQHASERWCHHHTRWEITSLHRHSHAAFSGFSMLTSTETSTKVSEEPQTSLTKRKEITDVSQQGNNMPESQPNLHTR